MIGAGKVAWHLGYALHQSGWKINQVFNRTESSGRILATRLSATYTSQPESIRQEAGIYLVCLSDSAMNELPAWWPLKNSFLVHISGSQPLGLFSNITSRRGVFYPLQTFGSKGEPLDMGTIPICIEASDPSGLNQLIKLAGALTSRVEVMDSITRLKLHLAAVMVNNFGNFILSLASDYISRNNLDPSLLFPLVKQTFQHLPDGDLFARQTGPAMRGDEVIIGKHLEMLASDMLYQDVYRFLTESIIQFKQKYGKL